MTKVSKLIELLSAYNGEMNVIDFEGQDFVHISYFGDKKDGSLILSTERPIGYCNRSGEYVFPTLVEDYIGVVPAINENVDLGEITLPKSEEEENINKFGEPINKFESKYKEAFMTLLKDVHKDLPQSTWDKLHNLDLGSEFETLDLDE
jgi:hypothetical protein